MEWNYHEFMYRCPDRVKGIVLGVATRRGVTTLWSRMGYYDAIGDNWEYLVRLVGPTYLWNGKLIKHGLPGEMR